MKRFLAVLAGLTMLWTGEVLAECYADRVNLRNDKTQITFNVELAISREDRARGLMFRESIPKRSGMLFVFDPPQRTAFWMKNTLIPLDIIFLDRTGTVVHVHENAIPGDETLIEGGDSIFAVLEIKAGLASRYLITPGTQMQHEIFSQGPAIWPC
ncbi:DUF192 domain-containing protein [Ruegeria atlantica]|uniref:DUF192 domain-containing protein n=1 Tax=Ruegeria atlantica TaxID=81569 RepID=UPI001480105E|nr:DUF192 domain-containing protein [Ruegeria atlantica]